MSGIRVSAQAAVIFFGVVDRAKDNDVITISTSSHTIAGTDPGRAKISTLANFPSKGRATGGVRAHTFLKGEDILAHAWIGPRPAHALGSDGSVRALPENVSRRDASGVPLDEVIGSIGFALN
jgi:DNA gyrase subunit A